MLDIFGWSWWLGEVPEHWRKENITPTFKKGPKEDTSGAQCQDQRSWIHTETLFPLNIRKQFYTVTVTEHWHRLSGEVVESPPVEIVKKKSGHGPGPQGPWGPV